MNCGRSSDAFESQESEPLAGSYFVSTYPPFSVWSATEADHFRAALARHPVERTPLGLYLHVPFCLDRCRYCYYMSRANPAAIQVDRYIEGLSRELDCHAGSPVFAGREVSFVYVGGGTPSMLSADQIATVLQRLGQALPLATGAEMTFECAPKTALPDRLQALRENGVTRLSMGVQQLDDDVLEQSGRVHSVRDIDRAWRAIQDVGFDITNLDLMVGLVGETEATFFGSLDRLIEMGPDSVTLYQLEIPLNTPLYRMLGQQDTAAIASWQTKHDRLAAAFERLESKGFTVRSAYSAVRDPDRHRFVYQDEQYRGADLLGLGASAFSYVGGVHQQNVTSVKDYLAHTSRNELPLGRAHALSPDERLVREFVLHLKLGSAPLTRFAERFGVDVLKFFARPLEQFVRRGWLEVGSDAVTVTRAGLVRVDRMIPSFYLRQHRDVRYS